MFGRLRPGIVAVDVDMARGQAVVAELVAWCGERDLWHVVRASGQPGHGHVLVVVGEQRGELEEFCGRLRDAYRVGRTRIDVRAMVRPLSAPHRSGATPPLPRGLSSAARALRRVLRALPESQTHPAPDRPVAPVVPLAPRSVPRTILRRGLPADWADYLTAGIPPAQVAGWSDASRSAVESTATWQMAAAGWNADQAWLAISQAHPQAYTKARGKGRRWWTACVWNPAVEAVTTAPTPPARRRGPDRALLDRIAAHRAAWLSCWTSRYPDPRRHTLRRVYDVLLDRMTRTASPQVPCPQRDLELDTGLSRPTVAAALEQLRTDGWIVLDRSFDPASDRPERRSHHAALPDRPPISTARGGAVSLSLPPSSSTPRPLCNPTATCTAALLGPRLWHLFVGLLACSTPTSPPDVARVAGWADGAALTPGVARSIAGGLARLAGAGLARCDEHGHWIALELEQATEQTIAAAAVDHEQRRARINVERAAYAQLRSGHGSWHRQREQALCRGAAARQLGARRWWDSLDPSEQTRRRAEWSARYRTLSPTAQAQVKTQLAEQRQLAGGLTEDQLHQAWTARLSDTEYHARAAERTAWYRGLDLATQRALVTVWETHRDRWAIQRRPHSPTVDLDLTDHATAAAVHLLADLVGARPRPMSAIPLEESA